MRQAGHGRLSAALARFLMDRDVDSHRIPDKCPTPDRTSDIVRAVSDRIVGPRLTVGDGPTNDRASGKPTEHSRACAGMPAMIPAVMAVSVMPATILHGLKRLG